MIEPIREWALRERVFSSAVVGALMGGIFGVLGLVGPADGYPARTIAVYLTVLGGTSGAMIGAILPRLDNLWKLGLTGGSVGILVYGGIAVLLGDGIVWVLLSGGFVTGTVVGVGLGWWFELGRSTTQG